MYKDETTTVFSADGQLLQVQYAKEAVRKGSPVVGVRGADCVVIASEKKPLPRLYDDRTEKTIVKLDGHVAVGYAGLRADARVLITRAQMECQAYRLTVEDPVTLEYITRYVAQVKNLYTQCKGCRPFGVSCLIGGVDVDSTGSPHLYQTEPSGIYYEWKAAAIGRNDNAAREYLEKNYKPELVSTEQGAINLALSALLECKPSEACNGFEVAIMKRQQPMVMMDQRDVAALVSHIGKQKRTADNRTKEPTK